MRTRNTKRATKPRRAEPISLDGSLLLVLGLTLFLSGFLLFWCQPMVAKMVLPLFGGSASVWTTCLLFFQIVLLAGYIYAHLLATKTQIRHQILIHGLLIVATFAFLPIRFADVTNAISRFPTLGLLIKLMTVVGVPFFVLSTTAPLLQHWLSRTSLKAARDPYFLYVASNTGSLLSLLMYPLFFDPRMGIQAQTQLWTGAFGLLALMVTTTATLVWKHSTPKTIEASGESLERPSPKMRGYWLIAAFVPSALMLAVTNHITMNLVSIPFLWVLPLAIYLVTFLLAFAGTARASAGRYTLLSRWSPLIVVLLLPIVPQLGTQTPVINSLLIAAHLILLFTGAYLCHAFLAARRPSPAFLTEFYFCIALGGALGGAFVAIVAPRIFSTVAEYPLLVAMLPFLRESRTSKNVFGWRDWIYPGIVGLVAAGWYAVRTQMPPLTHPAIYMPEAALLLIVFLFRYNRLRFALACAAVLFGLVLTRPAYIERGDRLYVARNFFGLKKVVWDRNLNIRKLYHGDTLHGVESMEPQLSGEPLTYYHRGSPAADVMESIGGRTKQWIGVVGLGVGSMAAYATPDRHMTFFELDPQMESIARGYFTHLRRCGKDCDVVIGDGRIAIQEMPNGVFDVLMLDAFDSDSIPPHLVSREALQMYLTKLKPDGILLFHTSSRYFDVAKLVATAITDRGLVGFFRRSPDENFPFRASADYIAAARRVEDLGSIANKAEWLRLNFQPDLPAWTDDYSNTISLVRWR